MTPIMTFLWPEFLWLLLLLPLLVLLYIWLLRRKKKTNLRYASLSIVREAMGKSQRNSGHKKVMMGVMGRVFSNSRIRCFQADL